MRFKVDVIYVDSITYSDCLSLLILLIIETQLPTLCESSYDTLLLISIYMIANIVI